MIMENISHFEALGIPFSLKGIFRPSGNDYLLFWNLMHIIGSISTELLLALREGKNDWSREPTD